MAVPGPGGGVSSETPAETPVGTSRGAGGDKPRPYGRNAGSITSPSRLTKTTSSSSTVMWNAP